MNKLLKLDELLKYQKFTIVLSVIVILVGLGAIAYQGGLLYGIEFTGGLNLEFEFSKSIDADLLMQIRETLQKDGSSVQVKTFSLSGEEANRGLMVTVRAKRMVTTLTSELYQRGQVGSESIFEEISGLESVRWIDAETLRRNFRTGEGDSDRIDVTEASRDVLENRVQSIVNETLIQEVVSDLRSSLVDETDRVDLNWASSDEIEEWIERQQLNGVVDQIIEYRQQNDLSEISELNPILNRFEIEPEPFSRIFSVGTGTRAQLNLLELGRDSLLEIISEEFVEERYGNVAREIVDVREEEGLFKTKEQFYRVEALDSVNKDSLKGTASLSPFVMVRSEMVSPSIGSELIGKSALAILISLVGILIYLYIRFQLTYSLGAIIAIIHDVAITLGFLTLIGIQFDVSVVAAVLTVIGYSLNDTIVNFDRVRENRSLMGYKANWYDVINRSVHEVLNRTMVTSVTTFIAVFVLYLYGGIALRAFSITLIIGVVVGTYSSIFVSNLSLYHLQKSLRST